MATTNVNPTVKRVYNFKKKKETHTIGRNTLSMVQRFYPAVKTVVDAKDKLNIEVTAATARSADVRKHNKCALAVQCAKTFHLDGAIVSRSRAYLVRGDIAVRYNLPESVTREIVSFDRKAGFEPGLYALMPPTASNALGKIPTVSKRDGSRADQNLKPKLTPHVTKNIRAELWNEKDIT